MLDDKERKVEQHAYRTRERSHEPKLQSKEGERAGTSVGEGTWVGCYNREMA